mgnify:CR=1 FL=1
MNTGLEAGNVNFTAERLSAMLLNGPQAAAVRGVRCMCACLLCTTLPFAGHWWTHKSSKLGRDFDYYVQCKHPTHKREIGSGRFPSDGSCCRVRRGTECCNR